MHLKDVMSDSFMAPDEAWKLIAVADGTVNLARNDYRNGFNENVPNPFAVSKFVRNCSALIEEFGDNPVWWVNLGETDDYLRVVAGFSLCGKSSVDKTNCLRLFSGQMR